MWKVITGKISRNFESRAKAIKFAKEFVFAQVINQAGYVQYVIRDYRAQKVIG